MRDFSSPGELITSLSFTVLISSVGLISFLLLFRQWMKGPVCESTMRLDGKIALITGANTGIGKYSAWDLSRRGAKVLLLCRSKEKGEQAAQEIRTDTKGDVSVKILDLSSLESVRECAEELLVSLDKIDILLNNAGIMVCPQMKTKDGFEMQLGTNHLGHFLLTNLLLPLLLKGAPGARIVNVSALAHIHGKMNFDDLFFEKNPYYPIAAYAQSKLANILFTTELARRLKGSGVNTYSLHPGVIQTDLGRHVPDSFGSAVGFIFKLGRPLLKTAENGSQTSIFCCVEESIGEQSGLYYSDCRVESTSKEAQSTEDARKLWDISEKLTKLKQA